LVGPPGRSNMDKYRSRKWFAGKKLWGRVREKLISLERKEYHMGGDDWEEEWGKRYKLKNGGAGVLRERHITSKKVNKKRMEGMSFQVGWGRGGTNFIFLRERVSGE